MDEIVVSEGLVILGTVVLGFVINKAAKWAGLKPSTEVKKAVVFGTSVVLTGIAMYQLGLPALPDPAVDPSNYALALLSVATLNFKAAQPVYDKLWQGLIRA